MTILFLILFTLGGLLGAYMLFVEPFQIKVVEHEVVTSKWGDEEPLRIALIADVHAIKPWMTVKRISKIVQKTNEQAPDIILLLGDYVSTHPFGIQPKPEEGLKPYEKLSAPCGVHAVLGNHDLHGSVGWPEALRKTSLSVLENKAVKIDCAGRDFWLGGLEDLWWQNADITKTISQVTDSRPVVMMMHNPDLFAEMPERVALSVAGHTHAGQIRFPFVGALERVIPSKYGERYSYGYIQENGKDLVVSGGLGTTGIPLRLLNPPEIVIVTLKGGK